MKITGYHRMEKFREYHWTPEAFGVSNFVPRENFDIRGCWASVQKQSESLFVCTLLPETGSSRVSNFVTLAEAKAFAEKFIKENL